MTRLLVVCDLDGTLTFAPRRPDDVVVAALQELARTDGVRLAIATARSARCVRRWLPELLDRLELVCCNGALTLGTRVVDRRHLPERSLATALRRLDREGVGYCLEYGPHFVATGAGVLPWMGERHRVVLPTGVAPEVSRVLKCSVADAAAARRAAAWLPGLAVVPHASGDADLMPAGVSKAAAVARLRELQERVVAFGNDHNDLQLLRRADASFVVGSGLPQLDGSRHVRRLERDPDQVAAALSGALSGLRDTPAAAVVG